MFEVQIKREEIFTEEPVLTSNALKLLERRYLKRDRTGKLVEGPRELFIRVAKAVAEAETLYNKRADVERIAGDFYSLMAKAKFLPNTPTLINAGKPSGQLSACFVLPVEDSLSAIFDTLKHTAIIHRTGGGTGFSFSRLRPRGDIVSTTHGVSSGPVSFIEIFDRATETIKQGGVRRGANMAILRVDHPDIIEFITSKEEEGRLRNFNISVALTNDFMDKVKKNEEYELINPRTGKPTGKLKADEVFNLIVSSAWRTGEPGVIFIDRINEANPTPELGEIESTNPCGEQPLLPYESCNLGSINLSRFVKEGKIDYEELGKTVRLAVRFLDDVIDVNCYPTAKIAEMTRGNRKIGLGVMGFADLLFELQIPYDSNKAERLIGEIMRFIQETARDESCRLAGERGVFPNYEKSIYKKSGLELRNASLTTVAPTGSISIIAGCSSGIEPVFALSYTREILDGELLQELHPAVEKLAKRHNFYSRKLIDEIAKSGSVQGTNIPERFKRILKTAHEIEPEWHIRIQAATQRYVDNAVSKTINFRNEATVEEIKEAFWLAYRLGCKGITVYRDRCRQTQVLYKGVMRRAVEYKMRPRITEGRTIRVTTGCGNLYVTINEADGQIYEVFARLGKAGGCAASQLEAICRLISVAFRSGIDKDIILKQLIGIGCPSPAWDQGRLIRSCSDAIASAINTYIELKAQEQEEAVNRGETTEYRLRDTGKNEREGICPDCGGKLEMSEGCLICRGCGYSKCG